MLRSVFAVVTRVVCCVCRRRRSSLPTNRVAAWQRRSFLMVWHCHFLMSHPHTTLCAWWHCGTNALLLSRDFPLVPLFEGTFHMSFLCVHSSFRRAHQHHRDQVDQDSCRRGTVNQAVDLDLGGTSHCRAQPSLLSYTTVFRYRGPVV